MTSAEPQTSLPVAFKTRSGPTRLSCLQVLWGPQDSAELHNGFKPPGETEHHLGSGPGPGPAESQSEHSDQHGVMVPVGPRTLGPSQRIFLYSSFSLFLFLGFSVKTCLFYLFFTSLVLFWVYFFYATLKWKRLVLYRPKSNALRGIC